MAIRDRPSKWKQMLNLQFKMNLDKKKNTEESKSTKMKIKNPKRKNKDL